MHHFLELVKLKIYSFCLIHMNIFFLNFEFYIFLIFFSFSEINEFLLFDNLYIDVVNFLFLEKTF